MNQSRSQRKPAGKKVREILKKLEALAERGIDGEKLVAQAKIRLLKERYDFDVPESAEMPDLFKGVFKRGRKAQRIYSFPHAEFELANFVKWAIEIASGVNCFFRNGDLVAEATVTSARQLSRIAEHIALSFRALLAEFNLVPGVSNADRALFVRGLYDGMMNDPRQVGQPLPSPSINRKKVSNRQTRVTSGLNVHPYGVAVALGKQIRFSVPVEQISAELKAATQKSLKNGGSAS